MKKRTSLSVLLLVVLAVAASHIGWTARDSGTLMVLDGREIDVAGAAVNQWTQMTRSCNGVVRLQPTDESYQMTVNLISAYSPPYSASVRLAGVWGMEKWVVAEAEFAELLPAVVLIDFSGVEPNIVSNAIWSGYTKPWKAAPFIRNYLLRQEPDLPPSLAACFEPQSPSFR
jgi:hypothetical protein